MQVRHFGRCKAHFCFLTLLCALLLALAACSDTTPTGLPSPSAPNTTQSNTTNTATLAPSATALTQITATPSPVQVAATATLPANITATSEPQTALQQFAALTSYTFTVSQTATLQSNGETSELSATGQGLYITNTLSQTVTLDVGGASQPIVIFVKPDNSAYQMASNLAVWQKLDNSKYHFGTNESFGLATNAKLQNTETLNNIATQKYVYQIAGSQLLNGSGIGPLPFGLLSASSILNGFAAHDFAATTINETVWIDPQKNSVLQRQLQFTLKNATGDNLNYQAEYSYQNFNQSSLNISTPANLPQ